LDGTEDYGRALDLEGVLDLSVIDRLWEMCGCVIIRVGKVLQKWN